MTCITGAMKIVALAEAHRLDVELQVAVGGYINAHKTGDLVYD